MLRPNLASLLMLTFFANFLLADHHEESKQYIELRYYHLKSADVAQEVDDYLIDALLPALNRAGSKNVGVLKPEDNESEPLRLVVIPHNKVEDFAQLNAKLGKDKEYQSAAKSYLAHNKKTTPLKRIRSELLNSFDCWPALKVPEVTSDDGRIFELRIYESSTQHFGDLKVDMFNNGEVPIFLDSGIVPVFMGQAIAGDKMPNLSCMTVYKDQASKDKGWKNFVSHPDWKVLSKNPKYKGTVSKIHKLNLVPMKGSQF